MIFSIIIPVYNVEHYLEQCLNSVLGQSFQDYEVICVNDGSTDGSLGILEQYVNRCDKIRIISQENGGLSVARNVGLQEAKGEYVLFLDSDDWLSEDALEILSKNIDGEDLLCFNGQRYFEDKNEYEEEDRFESVKHINGWEYYNSNALLHRNFAFVCVVLRLYRREFLLNHQLKFQPQIYHEDNYFTPQVCYYAKNVSVVNDVLYFYRIRNSSIMTTPSIKHQRDLLWIANRLSKFFVDKSDIEKTIVYRALTHHYQVVFQNSNRETDKELYQMVDWKLYREVSRTKLRHRLQYGLIKINPWLYRTIDKVNEISSSSGIVLSER